MLLKSGTLYNDDGSIKFQQTFQMFDVQDNGVSASAKLVCKRKPSPNNRNDQKLLEAGYKLDNLGNLQGNLYVTLTGEARRKAASLSNGAVLYDVVFEDDPYPYVDNNGQIVYRMGHVKRIVRDFQVRLRADMQPQVQQNFSQQPIQANSSVTMKTDVPFTYTRSPMYAQPQNQNVQATNESALEY